MIIVKDCVNLRLIVSDNVAMYGMKVSGAGASVRYRRAVGWGGGETGQDHTSVAASSGLQGTRFKARNCISEPGPQEPYMFSVTV
jgi:hypothetical protein